MTEVDDDLNFTFRYEAVTFFVACMEPHQLQPGEDITVEGDTRRTALEWLGVSPTDTPLGEALEINVDGEMVGKTLDVLYTNVRPNRPPAQRHHPAPLNAPDQPSPRTTVPVAQDLLSRLSSRAAQWHNSLLPSALDAAGAARRHPRLALDTSDPLFLKQVQWQYLKAQLHDVDAAASDEAIRSAIEATYPHLVGVADQPEVNEPNPELLTGTMLKARGWTAAMIDTFGLTPEHVKPNPYSMAASAPPMKLYLRTHVEALEQDEAFQQHRQGSAGRRARAQQAVETQRTTALAKVEAMDIQVVVLPAGVLRKRAIQQFNRRLKAHGPLLRSPVPERLATVKSDPAVLERISVEFIIDQLSNLILQDPCGSCTLLVHAHLRVMF